MKATMYLNYTSRSLWRGGQRTLLAIFCVAVGVMAIVALQLVGLMINNAFNSNVRDANGGDVAVTSQNQPLSQSDLSYFETLKKQGKIIDYTATINAQGSIKLSDSLQKSFTVRAVDAERYPLVTAPTFTAPKDGTISSLLTHNQVAVTQSYIDQYHNKIGDTFTIHIASQAGAGRSLNVKLAGIVAETGVLSQAGSVVLISLNDYQASAPQVPLQYDTVNVTTTTPAVADQLAKDLGNKFYTASVSTATSALQSQQGQIDNIRSFLDIAGLLALLIGGIGIVNTMQVLLSRRKTEIAMLKTTGYRRYDLYFLFGLEAALLGLIGGAIGAGAATGVSYLVRTLVEQTFGFNIPFAIDWVTVGGGVLIGVFTALIFGLLPIVQAANIRPLNVIREQPEGRGVGSIVLTIGLLLLLSVLFCALAIFILNNNVMLGIITVYGAFILMGLLSLFFGLLILVISKLPVLERFNFWYLALIAVSTALGVLLLLRGAQTFGVLLLLAAALGIIVVLLPRPWKANVKLALRNLGRQRTRTTTTMLALFVGVFTIGLILVLGQDLRDKVNDALANSLNYNVLTITSGKDTAAIQDKLGSLPGLNSYQHHELSPVVPVAINEHPLQTLLPKDDTGRSATNLGRTGALSLLRGIEGFDVGNNQLPDATNVPIKQGRTLQASDANTNNVLIPSALSTRDPLHLQVGDTLTFASIDRKTTRTLTIVGIYQSSGFGSAVYPILGTYNTVKAFSIAGSDQSVFYLKIDPNKLNSAVDIIGNTAPNAFLLNLANIGDIINSFLNDVLLTLTTIASLSLLAGIIIIANAVALAMLERRRELGILKSVGYTSSSILSEVLIENGLVGAAGALLAVVLVTVATSLLGTFLFKSPFGVNSTIGLLLIAGAAGLAMLTAALVAWGAVRVRPLEVLRYE